MLLIGLVAYPFFYAIFIRSRAASCGDQELLTGHFRYLSKSSFRENTHTITLVIVSDPQTRHRTGLGAHSERTHPGKGIFEHSCCFRGQCRFVAYLVWRLLFLPIGGGVNLTL
ncbi:MAG: hypothetical protein R2848_08485 [Thermomicrobiales bacterium]